jgi:CBS domain-containing protein
MMRSLEEYCVHESTTMMDAIGVIQNNNSRCVVVLNEKHKVIGMFSEGDVLRAILAGTDVYTPIYNLIKPSFHSLMSRDFDSARELIVAGLTLIPVLNADHQLKSVITIKDIFGGTNNA